MIIRLPRWPHGFAARRLVPAVFLLLGPTILGGQETDARIRQIQARFVSPCCWRENLAVHNSQVAEQLRAVFATLVRSGKTEPQIVDYFVARFGERILREPRGTRFRFLNVVPLIALVVAFVFVFRFLLRAHTLAMWESNRVPLPPPIEDTEWL